jgi:hypothetical protein
VSDTNNPTPAAEEPGVPPVPPAPPVSPVAPPPGGYQQPAPGYAQPAPGYAQPAPGYQQPAPPTAPGYPQSAPGYQAPPAGGYAGQQPAQGYQQAPPGYPPTQQQYYGYQPPATPPMNTLAIITIILAFVFSPAGIVTGHIALKQIDNTHESGRGLAKAGLIVSYVFTGFWVLFIIASIALPIIFAIIYGAAATTYSY